MDSPLSHKRLSGGVLGMLAEIERNIADGTWGSGAQLPTERELEHRFGIARNTLRKALKQLEAEGVIVRHVGRGTFVTSHPASQPGDAHVMQRLRGASPAEVMELRLLLEPRIGELAASRASTADLQRISECMRSSEAAPDVINFEHWDGMLHAAIVTAAHNELVATLYEAINEVRNQPEWVRLKQRSVTPERRAVYQEQHQRIVAALCDRDPRETAKEISQHLLTVQSNMLA